MIIKAAIVFGVIACVSTRAAPPSCKTEKVGETVFESCERQDIFCDPKNPIPSSAVQEQIKNPSDLWVGCLWPVNISKSHYTIGAARGVTGVTLFSTHIALVGNYRDSERMDVTVTLEQRDHTFRKYVEKDVPVILRDNLPTASFDITSSVDSTIGVPTVDSIERGGKKTAVHSYR